MSGELPFSPSKLKKMLIGLMTEYKRLEEEKKITDKDRENLFSELQKAERRIPELEKYKEFGLGDERAEKTGRRNKRIFNEERLHESPSYRSGI